MKALIKPGLWAFGFLLLPAFGESKDKTASPQAASVYESEGFLNYKIHCGICHSTTPPKEVAPLLSQVLEAYYNAYPDSADFVKKISDWVSNPHKSKSLLPGAISEHKIMPKLPYDKETIRKISEWMWNATQCPDPPKPNDSQQELGNC